MDNNIMKEKKTKCIKLTVEEFEALKKEISYYKKTIEELQDELDSMEAEKIMNKSTETENFHLEDYVSGKDRIKSSKSIKKTSSSRQGKSRKIHS